MQLLPEFRVAAATDCTRRDPPPASNDSLLSAPKCDFYGYNGECESSQDVSY